MKLRYLLKTSFALALACVLTACPKNSKHTKIILNIPADVTVDEKSLPEATAQDFEAFLPVAKELEGLLSIEDEVFLSLNSPVPNLHGLFNRSIRSTSAIALIVANLKINCLRNPMTLIDEAKTQMPGSTERIRHNDNLSGRACAAKISKDQRITTKILEDKPNLNVAYSFANLETQASYENPEHQKTLKLSSLNRKTEWQFRTEVRKDGKYQYGVANASGHVQFLGLGRAEFQINKRLLLKPDGTKKSVTTLNLKVAGRNFPLTILNDGAKIYLGKNPIDVQFVGSLDLFRVRDLERDEIFALSQLSVLKN